MDKNIRIQRIAITLGQEIQELQNEIHRKEVLIRYKKGILDALGNICTHPVIETYCTVRVGVCGFCLHKFRTLGEVDAILNQ
jgi:nitrite reductase/ring-hydroxylating ferredoxin subunit